MAAADICLSHKVHEFSLKGRRKYEDKGTARSSSVLQAEEKGDPKKVTEYNKDEFVKRGQCQRN